MKEGKERGKELTSTPKPRPRRKRPIYNVSSLEMPHRMPPLRTEKEAKSEGKGKGRKREERG